LILEAAKKVDKILQEKGEEWLSELMLSDRDKKYIDDVSNIVHAFKAQKKNTTLHDFIKEKDFYR